MVALVEDFDGKLTSVIHSSALAPIFQDKVTKTIAILLLCLLALLDSRVNEEGRLAGAPVVVVLLCSRRNWG